jgi:hypothetical protein
MTTTPNMSMVLPTDHGDSETWGLLVNAALTLNDSHDHSTGKGVKVPVAGLNIDADLSFSPSGTPRAITDLKAIDFVPVASTAVTALTGAFFISDGTGGLSANELYFRTTSGTNVKITLGTSLNVAAFAGGIGGDYSAVGAAVAFDDAADRYTFKQQGNVWARMASGEVRILETGTNEAVYVGLACPAALAASYSITLPLAAPGSTSLVQMDSAGVLTASNTIGNTLTLPATVAGTPNFTGAVTMASTLAVTGIIAGNAVIQANAGIDVGTNQHVTVHGTGTFKHGTRTISIPASAFMPIVGGAVINLGNGIGIAGVSSPAATALGVQAPVGLLIGHRILTVRFYVSDNATGSTTLACSLLSTNSAGTMTSVANANSAGTGAAQIITLSSINVTIATTVSYSLQVQSSAAQSCSIRLCEVDYDQP